MDSITRQLRESCSFSLSTTSRIVCAWIGWVKSNYREKGGAFRKAKNEIRRRKNWIRKGEPACRQTGAGKNSFSQTLSLFARSSGKLKILFKKSSSFRIKTAQNQFLPIFAFC